MTQYVFVLCIYLIFNINFTLPDPEPKPEKPTVPPPKPGGGEFSAHFMFDYFLFRTKPPVPASY